MASVLEMRFQSESEEDDEDYQEAAGLASSSDALPGSSSDSSNSSCGSCNSPSVSDAEIDSTGKFSVQTQQGQRQAKEPSSAKKRAVFFSAVAGADESVAAPTALEALKGTVERSGQSLITDAAFESKTAGGDKGSAENCCLQDSQLSQPQLVEDEGRAKRVFSASQLLLDKRKKRQRMLREKMSSEKKRRYAAEKLAVQGVFAEMKAEQQRALKTYPAQIDPHSFLLQFQRRCPPQESGAQKLTLQQLQHHLCIAVSALRTRPVVSASSSSSSTLATTSTRTEGQQLHAQLQNSEGEKAVAAAAATTTASLCLVPSLSSIHSPPAQVTPLTAPSLNKIPVIKDFSVKECKERCRKQLSNACLVKMMKDALQQMETAGEVKVKKIVQFAGQSVEVEETMEAASTKYQKLQQQQQRKKLLQLGGQFRGLDHLIAALDGPAVINSVEKSQADWEKFKHEKGLNAELRKSHSYLQKQAFLAETEWKQHEQNVELRRRLQQRLSHERQPR